jgi:ATP-dependent exoDNAse (exonuclease V) beta subunit
VVVIPFAEEELSVSLNDKIWYPIDEEYGNYFEWGRINFSSKLKLLGQPGEAFYEEKIRQDHMDSLNTLYVALTRAVYQLYLICPLEKDNIAATKSYSTLINHFVKNQGHNPTLENPFCWGEITHGREKEEEKIPPLLPEFKISTHWQKHLWFQIYSGENEETTQARSRGILIHDLLGEIVSEEDIVPLVLNAVEKGLFRSDEIEYYNDLLYKVTSHAALKPYYKKGMIVFNEQDILVPNASFVRPDRVVKSSEGWIIIDYKTGKYHPKHEDQLRQYEEILNRFETKVYKKYLVYIDNEIEVKNI